MIDFDHGIIAGGLSKQYAKLQLRLFYSKTHKHKYMNLVLAETVNDKNGSRRRITTLPDSFDMSVTFDQEGTCLLNF